jgi:hypothetical protein
MRSTPLLFLSLNLEASDRPGRRPPTTLLASAYEMVTAGFYAVRVRGQSPTATYACPMTDLLSSNPAGLL